MIKFRNLLTIGKVGNFGEGTTPEQDLELCPDLIKQSDESHEFLLGKLADGHDIYGATTGFGSSSGNRFDASMSRKLQRNLYTFHGCGVGDFFNEQECAAILLVRLNCLTYGASGVSGELLQHLALMARHRIFPAIPCQGSVGASGDLTPLSYLAAAMAGERKVYFKSEMRDTSEVYQELGIEPYKFKEREALAIMNGTSAMSAIAALAVQRTRRFANAACMLSGMLTELLQGRTAAFLPELHQQKPHPGQLEAAHNIFTFLKDPYERLIHGAEGDRLYNKNKGIQDNYSVRCAPHVIGVLYETLSWAEPIIEREVNSVNDNPVLIKDREMVLNGGHFFGGHIAQVCDSLKMAVAQVVNLLDRQMALLMGPCNAAYLSENLVARKELGEEEDAVGLSEAALNFTLAGFADHAVVAALASRIAPPSTSP